MMRLLSGQDPVSRVELSYAGSAARIHLAQGEDTASTYRGRVGEKSEDSPNSQPARRSRGRGVLWRPISKLADEPVPRRDTRSKAPNKPWARGSSSEESACGKISLLL